MSETAAPDQLLSRLWVTRVRALLRFSLRTLVLFALLAGSAGVLWWNWGPWIPAYSITAPGFIDNVWFSKDDQYVLISYEVRTTAGVQVECGLDVRVASTGAQHVLLKISSGSMVEIAGSYAVIQLGSIIGTGPSSCPTRVFNWLEGRELLCSDKLTHIDEGFADVVHVADNRLLADFHHTHVLYRLPDFKIEREWRVNDGPFEPLFLNDGRLLVRASDDLELMDAASPRLVHLGQFKSVTFDALNRPHLPFIEVNSDSNTGEGFQMLNANTGKNSLRFAGRYIAVSPDGKRILVENVADGQTSLCDLETGITLMRIPDGELPVFSADGSMFVDLNNCSVYDTYERRLLWHGKDGWAEFNPSSSVIQNKFRLYAARSGRLLQDLTTWPGQASLGRASHLQFAHNGTVFVTHNGGWHPERYPEDRSATVWRLRRPWQWYGAAYLPEFWSTTLLAFAFLWSVFNDRRTLRARPA